MRQKSTFDHSSSNCSICGKIAAMVDLKRATDMASELYNGEIQKALKSDVRCNAEYINKETGHTIMAKNSKIKGLVLGLGLPKGVMKPDNYVMGKRCYINGVEHPILTNEMILNGDF